MLKNNHIKKHTYKSQNTWNSFFAYALFQILKKHTYQSQNAWQFCCLSPFSNTKKSILINLGSFFAYSLFQVLKKAYLQISKYLAQFFCLFFFSNIKKSILTSLKIPGTVFLLIPFFKY